LRVGTKPTETKDAATGDSCIGQALEDCFNNAAPYGYGDCGDEWGNAFVADGAGVPE